LLLKKKEKIAFQKMEKINFEGKTKTDTKNKQIINVKINQYLFFPFIAAVSIQTLNVFFLNITV